MSELQEKREYYPDRSVKAVYFVDEQGRKQGNYTEYEQNSDKILNKLEYKDGAVWNGTVKTKDGYIIYKDGEKSKEFKKTSQRYDYSSGKLKRKNGSEWDFPFVDCVETETIENGESVRTKEFSYESLSSVEGPHSHGRNHGHFDIYTHKLRHTSYENGVRVDKIEKITSKTHGFETSGWEDRVAWTCTLKNGELTEYSDRKGYHASFEKGVPTGDYRMPLNKDGLAFNYSPCAIKTGDNLIDKISIPMIDSKRTFNLSNADFDIDKYFDYPPIVVEGTWNDGKFTGKAEWKKRGFSTFFSATWNDGKMTGDLHTGSIDCHWQDEVCDIVEYGSEDRFYNDRYTKAKYTLRNGKKDGLYQRFDRETIIHEWGDGYNFLSARRKSDNEYWDYVCLEESEYKDGKLHGMSRKYNKKLWLESETQYKDGKKHGFEKLYNSDGTVSEVKYWQEGKDCTAKYEKLKKIATKRINKEEQIEAETGVKTRLPKMNKLEKTIAVAKETLGLSK